MKHLLSLGVAIALLLPCAQAQSNLGVGLDNGTVGAVQVPMPSGFMPRDTIGTLPLVILTEREDLRGQIVYVGTSAVMFVTPSMLIDLGPAGIMELANWWYKSGEDTDEFYTRVGEDLVKAVNQFPVDG